jgi:hypothetical protein
VPKSIPHASATRKAPVIVLLCSAVAMSRLRTAGPLGKTPSRPLPPNGTLACRPLREAIAPRHASRARRSGGGEAAVLPQPNRQKRPAPTRTPAGKIDHAAARCAGAPNSSFCSPGWKCWIWPSNAKGRDYRRISPLDKSAIFPHTMLYPAN